ncbi:MxaL protein [Ideonella sp. DXS29W]|uniref:MxaL protein n=1 Tax=Ideonella lacteola TaxID=2984193 RepID=A0ABU9BII9_9BURK
MSRIDGHLVAAAVLLTACLARPQVEIEQALIEQVVVLDVTQSMNVEDEQLDGRPASRLAFAKRLWSQALRELPCGSRIGWGIFTEYRAFLLLAPVEVCSGLVELQSTLAHIDGRMAWSGNSEVAKGVHSAWGIAQLLPRRPSLVFVTDGHEAPPLSDKRRPAYDDKPGEVTGLIVGVGGLLPVPIPKTDPGGRPLGFWRADEVAQRDPFAANEAAKREHVAANEAAQRGYVSANEAVQREHVSANEAAATVPGQEHLSWLHEGHLRDLANERGWGYHRLLDTAHLVEAATGPSLARSATAPADLRPWLALGALALLLWRHLRSRAVLGSARFHRPARSSRVARAGRL